MLCAEKGDLDGIVKLISNGLDIQQCRGLGGYIYISYLFFFLLNSKKSILLRNRDRFTPLHHACNRGHAHVVSELIKMRIPVNCVNDSGEVKKFLRCSLCLHTAEKYFYITHKKLDISLFYFLCDINM